MAYPSGVATVAPDRWLIVRLIAIDPAPGDKFFGLAGFVPGELAPKV
jgi:hypothetical protein